MSAGVNVSKREQLLRSEIAATDDPAELACKRAELAGHWARTGKLEQARNELAELRKENSPKPHIKLSICIHLAEGLIDYFGNVGGSRSDAIQRAHGLSQASGHKGLQALSAAWLAQWDYARLDMSALARHVKEALSLAAADEHAALARANLVAGEAFHFAGRADSAQPFYQRARSHALALQDDATLSALMHNMAWQQMMAMRQAVLTGGDTSQEGRRLLLNAESAGNFDKMRGDSGWVSLNAILLAQINSLAGLSPTALKLYESHLGALDDMGRLRCYLFADIAWCQLREGLTEQAATYAERAGNCITADAHINDRAATHSLLAQVSRGLGDAPRASSHETEATELWSAHEKMQRETITLLDGI